MVLNLKVVWVWMASDLEDLEDQALKKHGGMVEKEEYSFDERVIYSQQNRPQTQTPFWFGPERTIVEKHESYLPFLTINAVVTYI